MKTQSDPAYWREQYRIEADENYRIRQAIGIDQTDPDETLTARAVLKKLRDEYERGRQDGRKEAQLRCSICREKVSS